MIGCLGTALGIINALSLESVLPVLTGTVNWWWALLFAGLMLMGQATFLREGPWFLGALVFASGTLGLVSLLTDPAFSGVVVAVRPVHVVFAAVFCMSAIVWGGVLLWVPRGPARLQS
jgi:hypothetical protein